MANEFGANSIYISQTQTVVAEQAFSYIMPNPEESGTFTCVPLWENRAVPAATITVTLNPGDAPFYGGCHTVVVTSGSVLGVE